MEGENCENINDRKQRFREELDVLARTYREHFESGNQQEVVDVRKKAVALTVQFILDTEDTDHIFSVCKYVETYFLFAPRGALRQYGISEFQHDVEQALEGAEQDIHMSIEELLKLAQDEFAQLFASTEKMHPEDGVQ